jgi:predicted DNA-binding transcriptional regulator AlpA
MENLIKAKEVQKMLKCSLPLIYKMADRGQLPCVRWECPGEEGKRARAMVRFRQSDIFEFIESNYKRT